MDVLAKKMGYRAASGYQRYESIAQYKEDYLPIKLVRSLTQVLVGLGEPPIQKEEVLELSGQQLNGDISTDTHDVEPVGGSLWELFLELQRRMPASPDPAFIHDRDIPIYASAQDGPDGMETSYEEIETVRRPSPLVGVPKGFGIYLVGEENEPAYNNGDILLCHSSLPPKKDEPVLVIKQSETGSHSCLLGFWLGKTADELFIRQLRSGDDGLAIPRSAVRGVHVVVGKYNRR